MRPGSDPPVVVPVELRDRKILLVDDEEANVRVLRRLLEKAGYTRVTGSTDPLEVPDLFREIQPDLVLLDLHMPFLDGFEVMAALSEQMRPDDYRPILILTGDQDPEVRRRALAAGARDFVNKPFETVEVLLRIKNLLETRVLHVSLREHAQGLEDKVAERTRELAEAQVEILNRLALAAEYRDDVTGRHAQRVGMLSALVATRLGLDPEEVELIRRGAPLHDVGKIGIPDAILMKPGPLTPQEFEVMKSHTDIGARILGGSRFGPLRTAQSIALSHHEWWDGTGYAGMTGEEIPLVGRIVAAADVFDSLSHERPYRRPNPAHEAVERIAAGSASHFDPGVVRAFLEVVADGGLEKLGFAGTVEDLERAAATARRLLDGATGSLATEG